MKLSLNSISNSKCSWKITKKQASRKKVHFIGRIIGFKTNDFLYLNINKNCVMSVIKFLLNKNGVLSVIKCLLDITLGEGEFFSFHEIKVLFLI